MLLQQGSEGRECSDLLFTQESPNAGGIVNTRVEEKASLVFWLFTSISLCPDPSASSYQTLKNHLPLTVEPPLWLNIVVSPGTETQDVSQLLDFVCCEGNAV